MSILNFFFYSLWASSIALGIWYLEDFSTTPGKSVRNPASLSPASEIARTNGKPLLLVFVHPKCSCSQATMTELQRILPALKGTVVKVLFHKIDGKDGSWVKSDLWKKAQTLPGVKIIIDPNGKNTKFFNVATSGHALLYSASGKLIYSGGLTSARGKEGASAGTAFIEEWAKNRKSETSTNAVYGCEQFGKKI